MVDKSPRVPAMMAMTSESSQSMETMVTLQEEPVFFSIQYNRNT